MGLVGYEKIVFSASNPNSKWPNPFTRISLGTKIIKAKAYSRTHGRDSQVTFTILRQVICIVLISVGGWINASTPSRLRYVYSYDYTPCKHPQIQGSN